MSTEKALQNKELVRQKVREGYSEIAKKGGSCCGSSCGSARLS